MYYLLNEAGVLQADVHEGPQVDQVGQEEHVQGSKVMVVAEPLQVQDLVQ